jgi:hypothetical protein
VRTGFWWGNLVYRENLVDLGVDDIKMIFKAWDGNEA